MPLAARTTAIKAGGIQLILVVVFAMVLWPIAGNWAASIVAGGSIAMLGHMTVTTLAYSPYRADRPESVGQKLMLAEMARLLAVGLAFALLFANWSNPWLPGVFGSFLLIHLVPAWWIHRNTN